jgi:hypothetical protein
MVNFSYGRGFGDTVVQFGGKQMVFMCSFDQFEAGLGLYDRGALVQVAFPFLSNAEREFLMTGITPQEWEAMFGGVDCEED